jgi:hypothetical protein
MAHLLYFLAWLMTLFIVALCFGNTANMVPQIAKQEVGGHGLQIGSEKTCNG